MIKKDKKECRKWWIGWNKENNKKEKEFISNNLNLSKKIAIKTQNLNLKNQKKKKNSKKKASLLTQKKQWQD